MELNLPPDAVLELYYESVAWIDTIFQTWLTITFAAIVALYIAVPIIRLLRILLVSLYITVAVVLLGRFVIASMHAGYYVGVFDVYQHSPFTAPEGLLTIIGPLLFTLLLFGSIATTVFLSVYDRKGGT